jgi:hypothetical protein
MIKKDVHFGYSVSVNENGKQFPGFRFYEPSLESLNYLSGQIEFVFSKNVKEVMENVKRVMTEKLKKYYVAEEMVSVHIYKDTTKISEYNKYWPDNKVEENEFPTSDFLFFLEEWYTFLVKYENNEIPNLKYAFHSDGVVIPPDLPDNKIE